MKNNKLGSSIAVMNAKGGVGKSTVTLAIAETLSYYYDKKVLVVDSDAQMSISVMLMAFDELNSKRANWKTLVGLLHQTLILGQKPDWKEFITKNVADVDDTQTIDILPGDLRLTLIERAVTEADRHEQMRGLVRSLLAEARLEYDYILIDCPPGLSLLTEIWLREADFHLAPVKPDFLAIAGLEMFREFKKINPDMKMAENLGILVNMKLRNSAEDDKYHGILADDQESRCFPQAIPHMNPIQHAARFTHESRSFAAKYPGAAGEAFRNTVHEMLRRTGEAETPETETEAVSQAEPEVLEVPVIAAPVIAVSEQIKPEPQPEPGIVAPVVASIPVAAPAPIQPKAPPVAPANPAPLAQAAAIASRFAPEPVIQVEVSAIALENKALIESIEPAAPVLAPQVVAAPVLEQEQVPSAPPETPVPLPVRQDS